MSADQLATIGRAGLAIGELTGLSFIAALFAGAGIGVLIPVALVALAGFGLYVWLGC